MLLTWPRASRLRGIPKMGDDAALLALDRAPPAGRKSMLYAMMTTAKKASLAVRPWPRARAQVVVILLERGSHAANCSSSPSILRPLSISPPKMHSAQLRSNAPSTLVSSWAQPDSVWFVDLLKVTRCHGIIDPACLDRMRSHLERVALAGREDGSQLQFWQAQKAESAFCSFPGRV